MTVDGRVRSYPLADPADVDRAAYLLHKFLTAGADTRAGLVLDYIGARCPDLIGDAIRAVEVDMAWADDRRWRTG